MKGIFLVFIIALSFVSCCETQYVVILAGSTSCQAVTMLSLYVYTSISVVQPYPAGAKKGHSPRFEPPGELLLASVLVLGPGRHVPALHWHRLVGVDVVLRPDGSTAADLQH